MIYVIFCLVAFCLLVSFIRTYTINHRRIHFNEMERIYDKMELYVYTNHLQNKQNVIDYLMPFKNYVVNNNYADIEIIFSKVKTMNISTLELKRLRYEQLVQSVPDELRNYGREFDRHLDKAIFLSVIKVEFLFHLLKGIIVNFCVSIFSRSSKSIKSFFKKLEYAWKNENIIFIKPC